MKSQPDLSGRTCIVTGANRGIGLETAMGLAALGARVVLVCRNEAAGQAALSDISTRHPTADLGLQLCDLSSLASVRDLAARLTQDEEELHVLVNNASVITRDRRLSADGLELQFATNHLASFLLTHLLLSKLAASGNARVVTVASHAHHGTVLDFDDLQAERGYAGTAVYRRSKLANILFTRELARRLPSEVTTNCLHPGVIATGLLEKYFAGPRVIARFLSRLVGTSTEKGSRTSVYLASSDEVAELSGEYFAGCELSTPSPAARDDEAAARLWEVSAELTGLSREPGHPAPE